jgi:hypothetical protein
MRSDVFGDSGARRLTIESIIDLAKAKMKSLITQLSRVPENGSMMNVIKGKPPKYGNHGLFIVSPQL